MYNTPLCTRKAEMQFIFGHKLMKDIIILSPNEPVTVDLTYMYSAIATQAILPEAAPRWHPSLPAHLKVFNQGLYRLGCDFLIGHFGGCVNLQCGCVNLQCGCLS